MPEQSHDDRGYSVDEMMDRLREGEREKEERSSARIVTRPDGTQVLKVKRRKRRSHQPKREAKARRKRRNIFGVSMVLGLFVLLGIYLVLLIARFNSRAFQEELMQKVKRATGAQSGAYRLAVTPVRARFTGVSLAWPDSSMVRTLELREVNADLRLTSLLGANWNGEEVFAETGVLRLGAPVGSPALELEEPEFDYMQYRCGSLRVEIGNSGQHPVVLRESEVTFRPAEDGIGKLLLKRGQAVVEGWDPMKIDVGTVTFKDGRFQIRSFRITPEDEGGELEFVSTTPVGRQGPLELAVGASNFPLGLLLGARFGTLVDARITGKDGVVAVHDWDFARLDGRLEFSGMAGRLREFRFLDNLRSILSDADFSNPYFANVHGVYRRDRHGIRLQNLEMEHEGQLVVRGTIEAAFDGSLSGKLQVGVRQGKIMTSAGRKKAGYHGFSDPANGYCWITLNLSGTVDDPKDDFDARLHGGSGGPAGDPGSKKLLENQFEQLTR